MAQKLKAIDEVDEYHSKPRGHNSKGVLLWWRRDFVQVIGSSIMIIREAYINERNVI